jgi:glycosyltransferase involved in cell wall biosynthesis
MPSYNQAPFLEEAITSVLGQDYSTIELVVMDGGSTDNSIEILKKYDGRIANWVSEPDGGQSDALNKGFHKLNGEIIGWLNSDDTYQPGAFAQVAQVFADPNIKIAMCSHFGLMKADGHIYDYKENIFTDHATLTRFWTTNGMTINQPCVFFRRSVLDFSQPIFDTSLNFAMDYDLWLRLTREHSIHIVKGHWANYRFHDTSKSGTGFGKFFPEWYAVSRRHWGKRYSPDWWKNWTSHLFHHYGRRPLASAKRRLKGQ